MELLNTLEKIIKQEDRFLAEDGKILKAKVYDAIMSLDSDLISKLLNDKDIKDHFFKEIDGIYVFDKVKLAWVIESKEFLPDSYTLYKNKIGLANAKGDLISQKNDISLIWPYKDCVLEGGQDREDQKRSEIFYNEILAPDEVNKLLNPKVLSNAKKITETGEENITEFNESDNLIIKGNNLLGLSSLLKRYEGEVKCIYIDPPYNTGTDSFKYNDKFNRSTWLTFMKNRLEIAKRLLSPEGNIFINLDYNEVHYCKCLMDEIFGEENFQREIIWRIGWLSGYKTIANNFIRNHDTVLFYSKDNSRMKFNKMYIDNKDFKPLIKKPQLKDILNKYELSKEKIDSIYEDINYNSRIERYPIEDIWNGNEYDDLNSIAIVSFAGETVSKMLGVDEVKGQKSEKLIERIIESSTEPGDIVLDFFMGSGTTAAVAHKMNRRYIGIEQMEYQINKVAVPRLQKVIDGEQSGISKALNWKGGGEFIYCELKELNHSYINDLENTNDSKEILVILKKAINNGHIIPNIIPDDIMSSIDEFDNFDIDYQKRLVLEILDKNKLYVNYSDIDDEDMNVSEEDRVFTHSFYNSKTEEV